MNKGLERTDSPQSACGVFAAELRSIRGDFGFDDAAADEGERRTRLNAGVGALSPPLTGLCLSGGGIRSACFAAGVAQALARAGLLEQFDYLSTVSGGGYLGGWLTAWIHRFGGNTRAVSAALASSDEPPELQKLRASCRYLAPRTPVEAAALLARIAASVLLHCLALSPLFLVPAIAPRLLLALVMHRPDFAAESFAFFGLLVAGTILPGVYAVAWVSANRPRSSSTDPGLQAVFLHCVVPGIVAIWTLAVAAAWHLNAAGWAAAFMALAVLASAIAVGGIAAGHLFGREREDSRERPSLAVAAAAVLPAAPLSAAVVWAASNVLAAGDGDRTIYVSAVPAIIAFGCSLHALAFSWLSYNIISEIAREWVDRFAAWSAGFGATWVLACVFVFFVPEWVLRASPAAVPIVIAAAVLSAATILVFTGRRRARFFVSFAFPVHVAAIFVLTNLIVNTVIAAGNSRSVDDLHVLETASVMQLGILLAAGTLISVLAGAIVGLNAVGLAGIYRRSLTRTFLASSIDDVRTPGAADGDVDLADINASQRPFPLVNMATSAVERPRSWRVRPTNSFTISPLYAGSDMLGYRPTREFGGGFSLGTAMALSGAAVSPVNAGGGRPPISISFLLAALGVRLGRWVGNPRGRYWRRRAPRIAVVPVVSEALGISDTRNPFVYLSDGGHFENLGIYELISRRCRLIVISDAGEDATLAYEDLGNFLRRTRVDFGVPVEIMLERQRPRRWALARIAYSQIDGPHVPDGFLLYLKAMVIGNEPAAVADYARGEPLFPHHPTSEQFFDERRFEMYRQLGMHTVDSILAEAGGPLTLAQWIQRLNTAVAATQT